MQVPEEGEDDGRPLAAEVTVGEEPIFPAENKRPQFAFDTVVRELETAVGEAQDEAVPLAEEVADGVAERGLRRDEADVLVEPRAQLGDHGHAGLLPATEALVGRLAEQAGE